MPGPWIHHLLEEAHHRLQDSVAVHKALQEAEHQGVYWATVSSAVYWATPSPAISPPERSSAADQDSLRSLASPVTDILPYSQTTLPLDSIDILPTSTSSPTEIISTPAVARLSAEEDILTSSLSPTMPRVTETQVVAPTTTGMQSDSVVILALPPSSYMDQAGNGLQFVSATSKTIVKITRPTNNGLPVDTAPSSMTSLPPGTDTSSLPAATSPTSSTARKENGLPGYVYAIIAVGGVILVIIGIWRWVTLTRKKKANKIDKRYCLLFE